MDLTHLRYFMTIATCGSMTAAARVLHVSQPTLTVAMRNLEERLATTLFLRDRTGVRLTKTGDELLRHAADVFALLERAEREIKGLESDDIGGFVIGCHESLGAYFLPGFMAQFLVAAPKIEITLWNGPSAAVQRAVIDRAVHFGVVVNAHPHADLVIVEMFHDAVDLFVAQDAELSPDSHRLRRSSRAGSLTSADQAGPAASDGGHGGGRSSLGSGSGSGSGSYDDGAAEAHLEAARALLRAGPLIFAGRVSQCQDIIDCLAEVGGLPARLLPCGDFELVKSLTLAGIGIGVLPRRIAAYNQEGRLRRLHPSLPFFPDTISLVYRADIHRTRATMRVKDALVTYGKRLDG